MLKLRRWPRLSQNFLWNRNLVRELVRRSSIGPHDLVLEVGPGQGIVTQELLAVAHTVVAVELDRRLYDYLKRAFRGAQNLTLIHADALRVNLPQQPYKVFANIPFSIEGRFIRRLLHAQNSQTRRANPPEDCFLIVRRALTERLSGIYREGLFSVLHKPFFNFDIVHRFRPGDFAPATLVQPVLLRITKRPIPLISPNEAYVFRQFVTKGFGGGRRIRQNLKSLFAQGALNNTAQQLGFSVNAMPSELSFEQWMGLFRAWKEQR